MYKICIKVLVIKLLILVYLTKTYETCDGLLLKLKC